MELDHALLDRFLEAVLRSYEDGGLSLIEARERLAHALTMAARGDGNLKAFMKANLDA
jgi:hypothetical protein